MPIPIDEPEDPGPRATYEEREAFLRAKERWAMDLRDDGGEPGDRTARSLRRLEQRHQRFLDIHSPIKAALWLALLRPVDELFARESLPPGVPRPSGVIALAEAIARKAIATGDVSAFNAIAERVEGKVGLRKGDVDPDADQRAEQTVSLIERVVEALTEAKLDGRFDIAGEATDITPRVRPASERREPPVEREVEREDPVPDPPEPTG